MEKIAIELIPLREDSEYSPIVIKISIEVNGQKYARQETYNLDYFDSLYDSLMDRMKNILREYVKRETKKCDKENNG